LTASASIKVDFPEPFSPMKKVTGGVQRDVVERLDRRDGEGVGVEGGDGFALEPEAVEEGSRPHGVHFCAGRGGSARRMAEPARARLKYPDWAKWTKKEHF
jgi:hypothetical protein